MSNVDQAKKQILVCNRLVSFLAYAPDDQSQMQLVAVVVVFWPLQLLLLLLHATFTRLESSSVNALIWLAKQTQMGQGQGGGLSFVFYFGKVTETESWARNICLSLWSDSIRKVWQFVGGKTKANKNLSGTWKLLGFMLIIGWWMRWMIIWLNGFIVWFRFNFEFLKEAQQISLFTVVPTQDRQQLLAVAFNVLHLLSIFDGFHIDFDLQRYQLIASIIANVFAIWNAIQILVYYT